MDLRRIFWYFFIKKILYLKLFENDFFLKFDFILLLKYKSYFYSSKKKIKKIKIYNIDKEFF